MRDMIECPFEMQVQRAQGSAQWTPELLKHAGECEICSEVVLMGEVFARDKQSSASEPIVNARYLWWRAHWEQQQQAAMRVAVPVRWAQLAALAVASMLGISVLGSASTYAGQTEGLPGAVATIGVAEFVFISSCALLATAFTLLKSKLRRQP